MKIPCAVALAALAAAACGPGTGPDSNGDTNNRNANGNGNSNSNNNGNGGTGTATIGPEGGTLSGIGVTLTVPAGALAAPTELSITQDTQTLPDHQYGCVSPVWRFSPEGLTFLQPVTAVLPLLAPAQTPVVYWSKAGGAPGWDALASTPSGAGLAVQTAHFSTAFVGGPVPSGHAIRGTIRGPHGPVAGIVVMVDRSPLLTGVSAADGTYEVGFVGDGAHTVTPQSDEWYFNPTNQAVGVAGADVAGVDFYGRRWHANVLWGHVTGAVAAGVSLAVAGPWSTTQATGDAGMFDLLDLDDGTYTLSPSLAGYTFAPPSVTVTVAGGQVVREDFVASAPQPAHGWVIDHVLDPAAGVMSLWCSGPGDLWAGGSKLDGTSLNPVAFLAHWDGSAWTETPAYNPQADGVQSLWGSGPDDVWAAGGLGRVQHWDGSAWTDAFVGAPQYLYSVFGFGPRDVWAGGASGVVRHWNGTQWEVLDGPNPTSEILAMWGAAATDLWGVGERELIAHSVGGAPFQRVMMTIPGDLTAVHGTGPGDAWAAGVDGLLYHYDGRAWTQVQSGTSRFLHAVWAVSPADAWAAGADVLHWDGSAWTPAAAGTAIPVQAVRGCGGELWAAAGAVILKLVP